MKGRRRSDPLNQSILDPFGSVVAQRDSDASGKLDPMSVIEVASNERTEDPMRWKSKLQSVNADPQSPGVVSAQIQITD